MKGVYGLKYNIVIAEDLRDFLILVNLQYLLGFQPHIELYYLPIKR